MHGLTGATSSPIGSGPRGPVALPSLVELINFAVDLLWRSLKAQATHSSAKVIARRSWIIPRCPQLRSQRVHAQRTPANTHATLTANVGFNPIEANVCSPHRSKFARRSDPKCVVSSSLGTTTARSLRSRSSGRAAAWGGGPSWSPFYAVSRSRSTSEKPGRVKEGEPPSLSRSRLSSPRTGTARTLLAHGCASLPGNPRRKWLQSRFEPWS